MRRFVFAAGYPAVDIISLGRCMAQRAVGDDNSKVLMERRTSKLSLGSPD